MLGILLFVQTLPEHVTYQTHLSFLVLGADPTKGIQKRRAGSIG